jgi:hypothetical protein
MFSFRVRLFVFAILAVLLAVAVIDWESRKNPPAVTVTDGKPLPPDCRPGIPCPR